MNNLGQRTFSFYWDRPELGGMNGISNHAGMMKNAHWMVAGPNGWEATGFTMFPGGPGDWPVTFLKYSDMTIPPMRQLGP